MILKERAFDASALGGSVALVLAAWWLAGQMTDHPPGAPIAEPRPTPTVTVTAPATQAPVTARTTVPAPSASPDSTSAAESRVLAVAASHAPSGGSSGSAGRRSGVRPGAGAPSGPVPVPPAATAVDRPTVVVDVSMRRPLGVLPDAGAALDLTVGGRK